MIKFLLKLTIACALTMAAGFIPQQVHAQAACGSTGETIAGAGTSVPETHAQGDVTVADAGADPTNVNDGDWILFGAANPVDVYAALIIDAGAVLRLKTGTVLNVYGDFINNGYLFVEPGATINFYGTTWTNSPTAVVGDGSTIANTTPGGAINFIAPRPVVPASASPTACVTTNYSGGNFVQNIDGGSVPMDIALHVQNANNINLINSNTSIEGTVVFDVVDGDISLGNNNLVFTSNGNWSSNVAPNEAFILTNGTTACAGRVEKLGLAPGATFVFPIGRAETYSGGRDFTPAMIRNDGAAADNFQIVAKSYAEAIAQGVIIDAPAEGIDRAWQITSTGGSAASLSLQHNSATNGADYNTIFGGDATAFITQYQGGGTWDLGTLGTAMTGTVSGSVVHARGISVTTTATNCTQPQSWFTKSNDPLSPLPVTLVSFTGKANQCNVVLNWKTASEEKFSHFEIEYSNNNGVSYTKIGSEAGKNNPGGSTYSFSYTPASGTGYYRLKMVDFDGKFEYSKVVVVHTSCYAKPIVVYPNPIRSVVYIKGLQGGELIQLYGINGQLIIAKKAVFSQESLDVSGLAAGTYEISVRNETERLLNTKVVKVY